MCYVDLVGDYSSLVEEKGKISRQSRSHLDPDIKSAVLPRLPGWRGAFGQAAAAQSHLASGTITAPSISADPCWPRQSDLPRRANMSEFLRMLHR
jgi:hypothetical protein